MELKCNDCLFFFEGDCYRYPPKLFVAGDGEVFATRPFIESNHACGEFKRRVEVKKKIDQHKSWCNFLSGEGDGDCNCDWTKKGELK